ncbi:MAG: hypothetical protein PVJ52_03105 [Candidatus Woesebacteria bacterium]
MSAVRINDVFESPFGRGKGFADLVSIILSNAVVFAGIILFLLLIFGGISIIIGAGRSNPENVEKGKNAITAALLGFAIVFVAYWIIQIVEVITGLRIINPVI